MKIQSVRTYSTEVVKKVTVSHNGRSIDFFITVTDGKVSGDCDTNMKTSYLTYFHETHQKVRTKHFDEIKKRLELGVPDTITLDDINEWKDRLPEAPGMPIKPAKKKKGSRPNINTSEQYLANLK